MKLQKVEILKRDTCYTYALKRVGKYNEYKHLDSYPFLKDREQIKIDANIQKGDIIVSYNTDHKYYSEFNSRVIDENGKLLFKRVVYNAHFYVYEGEGLMSDLTYDHRNYNYIRITEFDSKDWDDEDFIIRLK